MVNLVAIKLIRGNGISIVDLNYQYFFIIGTIAGAKDKEAPVTEKSDLLNVLLNFDRQFVS